MCGTTERIAVTKKTEESGKNRKLIYIHRLGLEIKTFKDWREPILGSSTAGWYKLKKYFSEIILNTLFRAQRKRHRPSEGKMA